MVPALKRLYKTKGALGVLEWIYDKKRFYPVKLFLKAVFQLFPYEWLLRTTAHYNLQIPHLGFTRSTAYYLRSLNIKIQSNNNLDIDGPCLIFGNHPTGLDPFIIASQLKRNDVYIVADIYQKQKGEYIGQHIVPIVYSRTRKNLNNRGFLNSIGFYIMRQLSGYVDQETVKKQNKQTIKQAANLLKQGHVVIIFPDGGSNNPELWYNGIGEIIKSASLQQPRIKLFAANIQGISTASLWRHFFLNRKMYLARKPTIVNISPQLTLENLCIQPTQESHEITERLRIEFQSNRLWIPNYAYQRP
jgi:1-acyl-sn-glycerol-3-phosphate acyltransferase